MQRRTLVTAWQTTTFIIALVVLLLAGCRGSGEEVAATETAEPVTAASSATPRVTAAPLAAREKATPTATAATGDEGAEADITATDAGATATAASVAATATRLAPIREELASYGVDADSGQLAWIHPPVTIRIEGYAQFDYANQYVETIARDFVLAADITWNTRYGSTGCGFVLRSDGDAEQNYDQYLVIATRGAQGNVIFSVMRDGDLIWADSVYANGIDPRFEWQNDTTNRLAVVARGDVFTVYSNGTRLGQWRPTYDYPQGLTAFVALNESGDTTCHYDNAWLWLLP